MSKGMPIEMEQNLLAHLYNRNEELKEAEALIEKQQEEIAEYRDNAGFVNDLHEEYLTCVHTSQIANHVFAGLIMGELDGTEQNWEEVGNKMGCPDWAQMIHGIAARAHDYTDAQLADFADKAQGIASDYYREMMGKRTVTVRGSLESIDAEFEPVPTEEEKQDRADAVIKEANAAFDREAPGTFLDPELIS